MSPLWYLVVAVRFLAAVADKADRQQAHVIGFLLSLVAAIMGIGFLVLCGFAPANRRRCRRNASSRSYSPASRSEHRTMPSLKPHVIGIAPRH